MEYVVLVDEQDQELGTMEKLEAHKKSLMHRAFSVFLHDGQGNVLLQRRALGKYHSPGLWTNACCSHPRKGETLEDAVHRRLGEELGIDCPVQKVMDFTYKAILDQGLTEHEFDHVFVGQYEEESIPFEPAEVCEVKWLPYDMLMTDIREHPDLYTEWFKIIMERADRKGLMEIMM